MHFRRNAAILAALLLASPVFADDDPPEVHKLKTGMPPEVASLISRIAECNHWGGEEPYDKARAHEIDMAAERLQCSRIDQDEITLRKKYKSRKEVVSRLDHAREL